ncbi:ABC transporter permease [Variovorax sp.]|uniref:ABC transporter permease n=1 Tax=Variovorax sp. TaxID=1871043 RepID=UPI000C44EBE2|nr:ABC transporter permease subunit [Variovorax sp.]KAF1071298.1 MAG: Histidine transport system permease protein HisQ [Variovorax sp.]MBS75357.1 polar amino acid ABC transporter permease [Variovorax sp.]TAJ58845.1 MAG: ABC transporter permease subunit [Variovorax sp.]
MSILHGFGSQLLLGALATVQLALASLVVGSLFGVIGCWLQLRQNRLLRGAGYLYAALIRGIPDLLVVFAVYFGGSLTLAKLTGRYVEIDAFAAGVFALSLSFGAYAAEIARGALLSVNAGQREAAWTLGLSKTQALWTVILPQAARTALAPFGNQSIVLLKQTSIVSIVGCDELMRKAAEASGATRQPFTMYLAVALIYLVLTGAATLLLERAERRASRYLGA